ncbi:MAG: aldehyde dehydrogenase family protein [Desulfuromonadaceae bacterium]|nr:aldehyde dehydrogenase family protein [Desulfuromonadaceae bacterium]
MKTFPIEKSGIMQRARVASSAWSSHALGTRIEKLAILRRLIVSRREEILAAVAQDAVKVRTEALVTDLLPTLEILKFNEKQAARTLAAERRPGSLLFAGSRAEVLRQPYGAVLIVAPWNNPFQLSMLPAATALLAGNAVIVKPSERTPKVSALLRDLFAEAGFMLSLLEIVEGGPETAAELMAAGPDLVFFTGGEYGGKAIYRLAAERMIPAVMELGGKDAMIVFADADLGRAAQAALYGAFAHDGQHCISVKRLLVENPAYEAFVSDLATGAARLRRGNGTVGDLAAGIDPETARRLQEQIDDAMGRGARLLTPIRKGKALFPAILSEVPAAAAVMREESFGPLLAVVPFDSEEEAARLANDCDFGLNASLWTADRERARRLAARLATGCVGINEVLVNAGHPALPFGGAKASGFGRYHGPEGLRIFTRPKAVLECRHPWAGGLQWFPYDPDLGSLIEELIRLRFGKRESWAAHLGSWLKVAIQGAKRLRRLSENRHLQGGKT